MAVVLAAMGLFVYVRVGGALLASIDQNLGAQAGESADHLGRGRGVIDRDAASGVTWRSSLRRTAGCSSRYRRICPRSLSATVRARGARRRSASGGARTVPGRSERLATARGSGAPAHEPSGAGPRADARASRGRVAPARPRARSRRARGPGARDSCRATCSPPRRFGRSRRCVGVRLRSPPQLPARVCPFPPGATRSRSSRKR